jgi:hypothetical protein
LRLVKPGNFSSFSDNFQNIEVEIVLQISDKFYKIITSCIITAFKVCKTEPAAWARNLLKIISVDIVTESVVNALSLEQAVNREEDSIGYQSILT